MTRVSKRPAQSSQSSPCFSVGDRGLCNLGPPHALLSLVVKSMLLKRGTEACATCGLHTPCSAFVVKSAFLRVGTEACVTWGLHVPCSAFVVKSTFLRVGQRPV